MQHSLSTKKVFNSLAIGDASNRSRINPGSSFAANLRESFEFVDYKMSKEDEEHDSSSPTQRYLERPTHPP
jgi:hypothetical protein